MKKKIIFKYMSKYWETNRISIFGGLPHGLSILP